MCTEANNIIMNKLISISWVVGDKCLLISDLAKDEQINIFHNESKTFDLRATYRMRAGRL